MSKKENTKRNYVYLLFKPYIDNIKHQLNRNIKIIKSKIMKYSVALTLVVIGTVYFLSGLTAYLYHYIKLNEPTIDILFGIALICISWILLKK